MGQVKYGEFSFPKEFGFTGSTGKVSVGAHLRAPRGEKYIKNLAKGGHFKEENRPEGREVSEYARGGMHLHLKKGALHKDLGVPAGKKIPQKKLKAAEHSENPKVRKRAKFADTMEHKWHHKAKGGAVRGGKDGDDRAKGDETKEAQSGVRRPEEFADFKHGGKAKKRYARGGHHVAEHHGGHKHVGSLHHKHHHAKGGKIDSLGKEEHFAKGGMSVGKEEEFHRGGGC